MSKRIALLLTTAATLCMISCDSDDTSCMRSTCDGSVLKVCRDGQIVEHKTCENGCSGSQCIGSSASYVEGQLRCEGLTPVKYTNGAWIPQKPCSQGQTCLQGICYGTATPDDSCTEGMLKCTADGIPQKCTNNIWINQTPCTSENRCVSGKCEPIPPVCTENQLICGSDGTPLKCVNNGWVKQEACANGTTCHNGECVEPPKCWNKQCTIDETCMNNVCVPNWQLQTPDGTKCDTKTWVEYCTNQNEAISCTSTKGVFRVKCATNCVVADLTIANDNEPWYPAFCDTEKSQYCVEKDIYLETPYCYAQKTSLGTTYYESSFQCAPKFGGGYFALDYDDYFEATACPEGCDAAKEHCADCVDKCNGNILDYCSETERKQINCAEELDAVCKSFSSISKADCFDTSDECETPNDTKTKCETISGKGRVTIRTCLHADNDSSNKNYWVSTSTKACPAACNTEKTDCAK